MGDPSSGRQPKVIRMGAMLKLSTLERCELGVFLRDGLGSQHENHHYKARSPYFDTHTHHPCLSLQDLL